MAQCWRIRKGSEKLIRWGKFSFGLDAQKIFRLSDSFFEVSWVIRHIWYRVSQGLLVVIRMIITVFSAYCVQGLMVLLILFVYYSCNINRRRTVLLRNLWTCDSIASSKRRDVLILNSMGESGEFQSAAGCKILLCNMEGVLEYFGEVGAAPPPTWARRERWVGRYLHNSGVVVTQLFPPLNSNCNIVPTSLSKKQHTVYHIFPICGSEMYFIYVGRKILFWFIYGCRFRGGSIVVNNNPFQPPICFIQLPINRIKTIWHDIYHWHAKILICFNQKFQCLRNHIAKVNRYELQVRKY